MRVCSVADFYKPELEWGRAVFTHQAVHDELIPGIKHLILVGCAQTAAVLDESMIGGMGDCWDFIIGWLID